MVEFYEIVKHLTDSGYSLVKHYGNKECWEKDGATVIVPCRSFSATEFRRFKQCLT